MSIDLLQSRREMMGSGGGSLPASVTIDGTPSIAAGDYVEFSIMNNVALYKIVTL